LQKTTTMLQNGIVQMRCKNSKRISPFSLEETQSSDHGDDQFVTLCRTGPGKN
jgi:hypothetical protein